MQFKKDKDAPPRHVDDIKEGDIIITCTCLRPMNREHLTDSYDNETCNYCGFFIIERRATKKDARIFNDKQFKKTLKIEMQKRKIFLDKEKLHETKLH